MNWYFGFYIVAVIAGITYIGIDSCSNNRARNYQSKNICSPFQLQNNYTEDNKLYSVCLTVDGGLEVKSENIK